ncbi:MAG: hypothetical protein ABI759_16760 [Candidatus Solibacter sp.]
MRLAWTLALAAVLPLGAAGWDDDHQWKLDEKETLRRSFDTGASGRKLLVDNIHGFVHVTGYGGSQVQVSIEKHIFADSSEALAEAKRSVKMDMSQQGNFVRLYEDGPFRNGNDGTNYRGDRYYGYRVVFDFEVQVPFDTELVLKTVNQGNIIVKKTTGDYEIRGLNGGIEMEDIAGSGSVHTLNGKVKVSYTRNPTKATEYKTLNGSVDIYFQRDLNAELKFKKLNGAIYTDFEVAAVPRKADAGENRDGKFVYRSGGGRVAGRAGKGGPELSFDTLNGNIRLHTKTI